MASVTITSKGLECIASGVVLADARQSFEITIAESDERLTLRCSFIEDDPDPEHSGPKPGISFVGVTEETAHVFFANLGREPGLPVSFGPLEVATFKERALSLIFHVQHAGATVEMLYSFWLRVD